VANDEWNVQKGHVECILNLDDLISHNSMAQDTHSDCTIECQREQVSG